MIFFFYGPNTFSARRKIRDLAEAYQTKTGSDFGLSRIDGAETSADSLVAALLASPFLATSRLVIVESLGQNKLAGEKVVAMLGQVPDSTVAVFYDPQVDQRSAYFKTISKHPKVKAVKYEPLARPQLVTWAKKQVGEVGGTIEPAALNRLIDLTGDDQWRLEQEISKLVNYNSTVTLETVNLLVDQSQSESIFDLVEAMSVGNTGAALERYQNLLRDRVNEIYILTMVTWQLRNLLLAKTAPDLSANELAARAGMSPYVAGKALAKRGQFSEEQLKQAFIDAVETDYKIKSGQGDPEVLVERLIYDISVTR